MLTTLRAADEVREPEFHLPTDKLDPDMVEIAEAILRRRSDHFDPATIRDKYRDALRELIETKAEGLPARPAAQPATRTGVIDLMAALKQWLAAEGSATSKPKARRPPTPSALVAVAGDGIGSAQQGR